MLPLGSRLGRSVLRMATVSWSGQSFSTLLSRYRSAPAGSGSKKLCPWRVTRSATPAGGQDVAGPGDRAGEVDQDALHVGMAAQQRGQHGAGAAPDIHHGADRVPPADELDVEIRHAVPGGSHERVEVRRDLRVLGEILPERPPEHLLVGRLAGADVVEQCPPGVGHPAADALEIEEAPRSELLGGPVAAEAPGACCRNTPLETRWPRTACRASRSQRAAAARSAMSWWPSAMRSGMRKVAATIRHQGVVRSSIWSRSGPSSGRSSSIVTCPSWSP